MSYEYRQSYTYEEEPYVEETPEEDFEEELENLRQAQAEQQAYLEEVERKNARAIRHAEQRAREAESTAREVASRFVQEQKRNQEQFRQMRNTIQKERKQNIERVERLRQETTKKLEEQNRRLQEIRVEMEKADAKIMQELRKETANIRRQMHNDRVSLEKQINKERKERIQQMEELTNRFNTSLNQTREEFKNEIKSLRNDIQRKEADQRRYAIDWLSVDNIVLATLEKLDAMKFFPQKLQALKDKFARAKAMADSPVTVAAAISEAISLYDQAVELTSSVYEKQFELDLAHDKMVNSLGKLLTKIKRLDRLSYDIDTTEGVENVEAKVNRWSRGDYNKLKTEINDVILKSQNKDLNLDQIEEISNQIEDLSRRSDDVCESAKKKLLACISKIDTFELINGALRSLGFQKEPEQLFAGDDNRNDMYAKFADGLGQEVVVKFSNNEDDGVNVHYDYFLNSHDQATYDRFSQQIADEIQRNGYVIRSQSCVEHTEGRANPHVERKNIEAHRAKK